MTDSPQPATPWQATGGRQTKPPANASSSLTAAFPTLLLGGLLVGLHVIVDPAAYDVSQLPRLFTLLVGLLVILPTLLLVPSVARRLDWAPLADPVVIAAAAFLAASALSLFVAINVSAGFTDLFRTLGSFLVLCLCLLVFPLDPLWRRRLLEMAVIATLVAVTVGGWETAALWADGWPGRRDLENAFLDGMMSNVNLFAGYLLLLLPWCLCGAVEFSGAWRGVASAVAAAAVGMLVLLQSRGAWLALLAAAAIGGITILRHSRELGVPAVVWRWLLGGLCLALAAVVAVMGLAFTDTAAGRAIDRLVISRPHQAGVPSDGGRTIVWGIATDMIADHPISGVGAGNFTLRMHEYFASNNRGDSLDFSNLSSDNWIQPHNDFLWVFAEKGLPGIIAFAAVFLLALIALRRVLVGDPEVTDARLATASLTALVAYLVLSCFDFPLDRVSHQVILAVHLAVIVLVKRSGSLPAEAVGPVRLPSWLVVPPVTAALLLGVVYSVAALLQEHAVMDARRAQHTGNWQAMRDAARRAATPWKTLDPLAVPVALLEGLAERQLGNLPAATAAFERALVANPFRLYVLQNIGAAYAEGGRLDEAITIFAVAADRYPDRIELRQNLAFALIDAARFSEAIAVIENVPEAYRTDEMREAVAFAREQEALAGPEPPAAEPDP
jgi:O-antigen ligase